MIRINLLPFRATRKKENVRRQISVFILSLFFVAAALYYAGGFWTKKINRLNTQIEQVKGDLAATTAAAREVDKISRELNDLKKKTKVIKNLASNRREPVELLTAMTELVVKKQMWFTEFSDVRKTVIIKGIALDNKTVADFMTRLEGSGLFSSVNLGSLRQKRFRKSLNLKSFEITCRKAKVKKASNKKAAAS